MNKVMVMAGRTGGHLMPALVIHDYFLSKGLEVMWLAAKGGMESTILDHKKIKPFLIPSAPIHGVGMIARILFPIKFTKAFLLTLYIFIKNRPDVALGMGGYVSGIGAVCARLCGAQLAIHEANIVSGWANRLSSYIAHFRFTGFEESQGLRLPTVHVGNPLRRDFFISEEFKIGKNKKSKIFKILILGGSQGAEILNLKIPKILASLKKPLHVYHQTGVHSVAAVEKCYKDEKVKAQITHFIENPASLIRECDVLVTRAGALTISEVCQLGAVAILIPFAQAAGDHQRVNARFLEKKQAALVVDENELDSKLASVLKMLLNDLSKRTEISKNALALASNKKAEEAIFDHLYLSGDSSLA